MKKYNCPNIAKKLIALLIVSLIFAIHFQSNIYALTSENINFQGKIVRNDTGYEGLNIVPGSPACVVAGSANDSCDFQVSYYTAPTGGTLLLRETFNNVEIGQYDGVFELSLGSGSMTTTTQCRDGICNNPLEVISEYKDLYIELKFAPDGTNLTETFSRMPLEASAYSILSKFSEGANDAFKLSTSLSSQTQSNPVTGMVYYNTTSSQLTVYNGASWQGLNSSLWTDAGTFTYLTSTTDDLVLGASTVSDSTFYFDMDGSSGSYLEIDNASNSDRLFTILSGGNVGIGTSNPTAKLEVAGSSSTITNSSGDLTLSTGGLDGNILFSPNGAGKVKVNSAFGVRETGTTPTFYTFFQGGDQSGDITYTLPTSSSTGLLKNTAGVLSWDTSTYITGLNWSQVTNGSGVYMDYRPNNVACSANQILKYTVGTGWVCATDTDTGDNWGSQVVATDTLAIVGNGTSGSPLDFSYTATLASNPAMAAGETIFGSTGILFEGSSANTYETLLTVVNPTTDITITLPNATGTVPLGTGTANYIAYWTGANTLGSEQRLAISRGGTNASTYTSNQFLWYNGSSIVASGYNQNSFASTSHTHNWSQITNGSGIYMDYRPNNVACSANQVLKYTVGTGWVCADDIDTNTDSNDYVDSVSFNSTNGVLTLGRTGTLLDLTTNLDGRYLQTFTEADTLQTVTDRGATTTIASTFSTSIRTPLLIGNNSLGIRAGANSTTAIQLQNASGTSILNVDTTNSRVGIGTTSPATKLHIDGDGGILAQGAMSTGWDGGSLGTGSRLMWIPSKGAFRAGYVSGTQWNTANIGDYSVAMGIGTTARGDYSTAMGYSTTASGEGSTAMGDIAIASGYFSTAMGSESTASGSVSTAMGGATTASGIYSTAMGHSTTASGYSSTAMGLGTTAQAYGSTVIGQYNVISGSTDSWVGTDPIFVIGIGTSTSARVNAMTVLKNGNVGIRVTNPTRLLQLGQAGTAGTLGIAGSTSGLVTIQTAAAAGTWTMTLPTNTGSNGQVLTTNGSGVTSWTSPSSSVKWNAIGNPDGHQVLTMNANNSTWNFTTGALRITNNSTEALYVGGGNVGIGTNSPVTRLHVANDGGILAQGTYGSGWDGGSLGVGSRLMWIPSKAAFRAGYVNGTEWNTASIGDYSVAMGLNTTASAWYSTAMGDNTIASGGNSTAMGYHTTASGWYSTAMGRQTSASGDYSTAIGYMTTASGYYSTAMGQSTNASGNYSTAMGVDSTTSGQFSTAMGAYTTAQAYASTVLGRYNIISGNTGTWAATDPIFVIGIGSDSSNRANAMTVLKNGNVGIGPTSPVTKLHIDGDGGILAQGTSSSGWDGGSLGGGSRLMWIPSKGAFRAGTAVYYEWDASNIGSYSVAMGFLATASGGSSTAMGYNTIASGEYSTAIGRGTTASGEYSTAMGYGTTASGNFSTAMGEGATAQAYASTVLGRYNVISGNTTTWTATDPIFVIGIGTSTSARVNAMTVLKNGNVGIGATNPTRLLQLGQAGKAGTLGIAGTTSGLVTIQTAAVAGTWTMTLPTGTGTNGQVLTTNGSGVTSWTTVSGGGGGSLWSQSGSNIYYNGGNVGIGTNSPQATLHVNGNVFVESANNRTWGINNLASGHTVYFQFGGDANNRIENTYGSNTTFRSYHGTVFANNQGNIVRFGTASNSLNTNFFGNVGIVATNPTTLLQLGQSGTAGTLGIAGSTSGLVTIRTAAAAGTWTMTLPTNTGTNGQVLTTNGSGVTSWTTVSGGGGGSLWSQTGSNIYYNGGNVGIGSNSPVTRLHIANDGGILAQGTEGSGWDGGSLGAGSRLMWIPSKSAFRAGYVFGTRWDTANIGAYSVAMGNETTASGQYSTAMGTYTTASGIVSTALGNTVTASGHTSTAMGYGTTASGMNSTAMGYETTAQAYGSTVIGRYNVISGNTTIWTATDPIFVIGIGADASNRANAMTVLKNGNVGIRVTNPTRLLQLGQAGTAGTLGIAGSTSGLVTIQTAAVAGTWTMTLPTGTGSNGQVLTTNGSGVTSWTTVGGGSLWSQSGNNIYYTTGNVSIGTNSPVTRLHIANDGGILAQGTDGTGWDGGSLGGGSRLMWIPGKGAFRAGAVNSTQWNTVNIGSYSVAMGISTTASGNYSTAMGFMTTASGTYSTAMGSSTTASALYSTAMGSGGTTASGDYSTAMGYNTTAQAYNSTVIGRYNVISGNTTTWTATDPIFVIGIGSSTSARANAITVLKNGRVGIGTTSPQAPLHVSGNVFVGDGAGEAESNKIFSLVGSSANNRGRIHSQANDSLANSTNANTGVEVGPYRIVFGANANSFYTYYSNASSVAYRILTNGTAMDLAEWYPVGNIDLDSNRKSTLKKGEILCLDNQGSSKVVKCDSNHTDTIGIVSTAPYTTMGNNDMDDLREDDVEVALIGRVPAIVTSKNGAIQIGDYITSSNLRGVGERATTRVQTVGKALDEFNPSSCTITSSLESIVWPSDESGSNPTKPCFKLPDGTIVGKIMVFVNVSWYNPSETYTTTNISQPGWYRVSQLNGSDDIAKFKINNSSIGSSQNLILSVNTAKNTENVNIVSNFVSGGYDVSKARINNVGGIKYLEIYLETVNQNRIKVNIEGENWISTDITQVEGTPTLANEFTLSGVLFGISDILEVRENGLMVKGDLLSTNSASSNIGNGENRWNDIYAKGAIRLGSGSGQEGAIRFNTETMRLELSNNGGEWIPLGDRSSQLVLSPEYPGAILFADGSDNLGKMTSDAIEGSNGTFSNYYEWVSNKEIIQDYDILVRITLPNDFVSWKENAVSLDYMTENSVSAENNSVDVSLIGNSGVDAVSNGHISKLPGAWERLSIQSFDINDCNTSGDSCTLRISLKSSMDYFVRVGDITLNYNRSL